MATDLVANNLPGNTYAVHPTTGANLIDISDGITDAVMVEIDPVLQMRSMAVTGVVDGLQVIASEKNGELAGINLVILWRLIRTNRFYFRVPGFSYLHGIR